MIKLAYARNDMTQDI